MRRLRFRYGDVWRNRDGGYEVRVYRVLNQSVYYRTMVRPMAITRVRPVESFEAAFAFVRGDER